ncbi:MAG: BREX-2 system adenine-specific DNA-methyltransferase PglX, partial [Prochlorotrichaceae cyanobacterium]
MLDRSQLLKDLQSLLPKLEEDLRQRAKSPDLPEVQQKLQAEYQQAKAAKRTAQTEQQWQADYLTQIASAWVLSCVFVRFLEDNRLIEPPKIAGAGERLQRARDEHELYFQTHPTQTDRDYLLHLFTDLAQLPGAQEVFGETNPLWTLPTALSGDAAGQLLAFFQRIDANTGVLIHDFQMEADPHTAKPGQPQWDTRFLGDLYQDLSEAVRKNYALLQTPDFVESFILDRSLEPAIETFGPEVGLEGIRLIDPACGSGHFLLGAFQRIFERWQTLEPGTNPRVLAQRALDAVHGVDINPYAVAIARFRLLVAAMAACGVQRLKDAPDFRVRVACGDSLLHGEGVQLSLEKDGDWSVRQHHFATENQRDLMNILQPRYYHAVVANPPYIVPKDKALNEAYRKWYSHCYRQYSLAVPFMERIFELAVPGGFTGQITANSFMKREFGKKLIEGFFPRVNLTHVIDTSGAYIPGHGTPTVILFGRQQEPVERTIRTVMGIRGEPTTPENPAKGLVWSAILEQVDCAGSESEFVSVGDSPRQNFHKHPWSIGGGGAAELKEWLDKSGKETLGNVVKEIGFLAITGEDEVFTLPHAVFYRQSINNKILRDFVIGELIRDWGINSGQLCLFPYDNSGVPYLEISIVKYLWFFKSFLNSTLYFTKTKFERNMNWWEYVILLSNKLFPSLSIAFAFVASHNHFVLDRGGKVFKQTAPVIKLPSGAKEDEHLA